MTSAEDRTATIGDLSLHYLDWGTAGLPPLVCLHGITQTAHSWDEVAPALARTHHVRALDQRGHGDSTWAPDGDYRIATQNHDIEDFLRAIDAAPAVLVALSMGGLVAMTLAARAPDLVRALVVVDIAPEVQRRGVDNIRNFIAATDELDHFEDFVTRAHAFNPRRALDNIRERLQHNLQQLPNGRWTWKYDPALRNPALSPLHDGCGDAVQKITMAAAQNTARRISPEKNLASVMVNSLYQSVRRSIHEGSVTSGSMTRRMEWP